jgi:predicted metal-dependent phosphoesterase TrpH
MDSTASLENIIARCQKKGINCIAVTDHNAVEGGLRMQELAPFTVIPGEEVLTPEGEVIGYFLKEWIPSGQSIEDVFEAIKSQGGLIGLPHPFDTFRGLKMDIKRLEELAAQVDVIEVFNARAPISRDADKALAFAMKFDLAQTAGSDSHSPIEIGNTYVEMPAFDGKETFLGSLRAGVIHGKRSSMFVHFYTVLAKMKPSNRKNRATGGVSESRDR